MNVLPFKRVLLSGGTGFLGSYLIPMLLEEGCEVSLLTRSHSRTEQFKPYPPQLKFVPLDGLSLDSFCKTNRIEAVIHAACNGRHGGKQSEIEEANVLLGKRLLQAAISGGAKYFLHTDTALSCAQDYYVQTKKRFREELVRAADQIAICNLLIQPVYGPGAEGFLNSLLEKIATPNANRIPLTECKQVRDIIHIEDCISALRVLLRNLAEEKKFSEVGVGTGRGYRIKEMVELMMEVVKNPNLLLEFGVLPDRASEPSQTVANIERLLSLGWEPQISLRDGINKLHQYYMEHFESEPKAA